MPDRCNLTLVQEGEGGDHILAAIGTAASTIQRHEYLQRRPELKHNGGGANGDDKGSTAGEAQQDQWSPCFPSPAWCGKLPVLCFSQWDQPCQLRGAQLCKQLQRLSEDGPT